LAVEGGEVVFIPLEFGGVWRGVGGEFWAWAVIVRRSVRERRRGRTLNVEL
jgi:hypothetical protein